MDDDSGVARQSGPASAAGQQRKGQQVVSNTSLCKPSCAALMQLDSPKRALDHHIGIHVTELPVAKSPRQGAMVEIHCASSTRIPACLVLTTR